MDGILQVIGVLIFVGVMALVNKLQEKAKERGQQQPPTRPEDLPEKMRRMLLGDTDIPTARPAAPRNVAGPPRPSPFEPRVARPVKPRQEGLSRMATPARKPSFQPAPPPLPEEDEGPRVRPGEIHPAEMARARNQELYPAALPQVRPVEVAHARNQELRQAAAPQARPVQPPPVSQRSSIARTPSVPRRPKPAVRPVAVTPPATPTPRAPRAKVPVPATPALAARPVVARFLLRDPRDVRDGIVLSEILQPPVSLRER